jgi:type II restriction/modification system DNA methylase subunit YeeA
MRIDENGKRLFYDNLFDDLFTQTPKAVWDMYIEEGYTLRDAIKEERSQA